MSTPTLIPDLPRDWHQAPSLKSCSPAIVTDLMRNLASRKLLG